MGFFYVGLFRKGTAFIGWPAEDVNRDSERFCVVRRSHGDG